MRFYVVCLLFTLTLSTLTKHETTAIREVSHEDIRDAIMSLVHMFRDNTDKLERHELRSRQLGEQLKKAFTLVEKKLKTEEDNMNSVVEILTTMDKKIQSLESKFSGGGGATDDGAKQNEFLTSSIEALNTKLDSIEKIATESQSILKTAVTNAHDSTQNILKNIADVSSNIASISEKTQSTTQGAVPTEIIEKIEAKLEELKPALLESEKSFAQILNSQKIASDLLTTMSNDIGQAIKSLPDKDYIAGVENATVQNIQELKYDVLLNSEKGISRLQDKLTRLQEQVAAQQDSALRAITTPGGDRFYLDVQTGYDQLLKEIKGLSKIEQVLIQTADNVLDAKRRIEYGTHQILLEVGDLVKQQAKEMNSTINKRFDDIEETILENQSGALTNLSTKIETEISQVWRQIGIMYQTLTASAMALDRLQHQTEIYVNGSLSTMDSMEGKVGQITGRMSEVDDNLNYLLGRLSLVTQEFNQIKRGLGEALDNIRSSFHTVQEKVKDVGPGPNPIEEDKEPSIELKNTQYVTQ